VYDHSPPFDTVFDTQPAAVRAFPDQHTAHGTAAITTGERKYRSLVHSTRTLRMILRLGESVWTRLEQPLRFRADT
jgi:hypothetical protein